MHLFFIIADTLQLFLHVEGLHYSIMKQLNINRLNFQVTKRTVSVSKFYKVCLMQSFHLITR